MEEKDTLDVRLPKFQVEQLFKALSQSADWGLEQMQIMKLWTKTKGAGIKIAVLDTGCPAKVSSAGVATIHPDLRHNIILGECESFVPNEDIYDYQGHSTAVCGVIAAEDNQLGFVGYAPEAKIITYKVLDKNGAGSLRWIENALKKCVETKPDIVSMSLGSIVDSSLMHTLVKKLDSMGIPVICAAGNGADFEGVNYPAKYDEAFAIGAYDKELNIADFSAIGSEMDFAFPGVDIETTWLDFGYTKISGTSFACPACTGLVALIMAEKKAAGFDPSSCQNTIWLYNELKATATNPKKLANQTDDWGWGYIDVQKLIDDEDKCEDPKPIAVMADTHKNNLISSDIMSGFSDEQIRKTYNEIFSPKQPKQIFDIINNMPNAFLPALLIHRLQFKIGGSTEDFLAANNTLKDNLLILVKKNYSIWNPFYWIYRRQASKLKSAFDSKGETLYKHI